MASSSLSFSESSNRDLIHRFYTAFSAGEAEKMAACYHPDVIFTDPAFGNLKGKKAGAMWQMLLERSKGELEITYSDVVADEDRGSVQWVATYVFQATGRRVVNRVRASFEFQDGKILRHTDSFDFWKWARQALGWKGWLLGWTKFMQNKVQHQTNRMLQKYLQKRNSA